MLPWLQAEYSLEKEAASVPSYPGAVDHLRSLLEQHRPFYAVVDGLNMAHRYGHINIKSVSSYWWLLALA